MSCRLSASAWPTLKNSERPFWESDHQRPFCQKVTGRSWMKSLSHTFGRHHFSSTIRSFVSYYCSLEAKYSTWVYYRVGKKETGQERNFRQPTFCHLKLSVTLNFIFHLLMLRKKSVQRSCSDATEILSGRNSEPLHILWSISVSSFRFRLPCNSVFDVVEQTLWHERILIQVNQVWSLQVKHKRSTVCC